MQHVPHAHGGSVGQQDEAQVRGRLVVVQTVLAGAVADEGVVVAAELAHHVAQAEDGAEDELRVVARAADGPGAAGLLLRRRGLGAGRRAWRRWGQGGLRGREPFLGVDAFGWEGEKKRCLLEWEETGLVWGKEGPADGCDSLCLSKM